MSQKLFAFWGYDIFPYVLGGEVEELKADGDVTVKGYRGMKFTPIKLFPLAKGRKIHEEIITMVRECNIKTNELQAVVINKKNELLK
jgi:hypothetical protein